MSNETAIRLAATLYERRDLARDLFGDDYGRHVDSAKRFIRDYMERWGSELMPSVLAILKMMADDPRNGAQMASLAIQAACVEMADTPKTGATDGPQAT